MAGKYQPALLAGLVLGVLSSLPIVSAANCCCGLWFVTAGVLAAWLMQQNQPFPIALGDGALAGLLAGVVGAAVWGILYLPIHSVTGVWQRRLAERVLDSTAELPPHLRDLIETSQGAGGLVFGLVFGLMFMLVVGGAFATLGGLLGALLFRKDAPPPPFGPPGPPPPFVPPPPAPVVRRHRLNPELTCAGGTRRAAVMPADTAAESTGSLITATGPAGATSTPPARARDGY